jgi:glycosyltransferase involved in cell wall biosynthesis
MMKVGMLTYGLDRPLTGIGRYTIELAKALRALPDGPEVILLQAGSSRGFPEAGFRKFPLPGCGLLPGLLTLGNALIPWYVRRLDLNILHDPSGVAPFLLGAGRAKIVLTLHDVIPWKFPKTAMWMEKILYRYWLPLTIRRTHTVITPSAQSRQDIIRYAPAVSDRIHVLPEGIAGCFRPLPKREVEEHLFRRFHLSPPFILNVSTKAPRKNVGGLVEAFLQLAGEFPRITLVLAGSMIEKDFPGHSLRRNKNKKADRVRLLGLVSDDDLAMLYNGSDVFVFPSLYEGFGLPPLEAMACGTPVICSGKASLPEVVGDAARLIDPENPSDIVGAVREVLADPRLRAEMGERGLRHARLFSWEQNAQRTLDIYRELVP